MAKSHRADDAEMYRETSVEVAVPMTPTIRRHFERRVAGGEFANAGEYLRTLIAFDRRRHEALEEAIREGLESGYSDRSIEDIVEEEFRRYSEAQAQ